MPEIRIHWVPGPKKARFCLRNAVLKLARHDAQVRRFMTVPGDGPITALCFKAAIDDPTRFKRPYRIQQPAGCAQLS